MRSQTCGGRLWERTLPLSLDSRRNIRWQDYTESDPTVCHGLAWVKGTRIMASVVLDNLGQRADGG